MRPADGEDAMDEERRLLAAAGRGRTGAFERLVERHLFELRAYAVARSPSIEAAEEVVQATLVAFYQSLDRVPPGTPVIAWLKGIARNKALEERRQRKGSAGDRYLAELAVADDPDDDGWTEPVLAGLQRCLARLPAGSRALVRGRYEDGQSLNELARRFRRKHAAIAKALSRIRAALRTCLEREVA